MSVLIYYVGNLPQSNENESYFCVFTLSFNDIVLFADLLHPKLNSIVNLSFFC